MEALIKRLNKEIELKTIQRDKWVAASKQNYAEAAKLKELEKELKKELDALLKNYLDEKKIEKKYNL